MTDDKYSVDKLIISKNLKKDLKQMNISNLEDLLSFMLGMPWSSRAFLGADYDDVKKQIYGILPQDRIKEMEEYAKNPPQHGFGALRPSKKK